MDNLVFHPTLPRVIAVLDWELSTISDPLSDVANLCMQYHMSPSTMGVISGVRGLHVSGLPSQADIFAAYGVPVEWMKFYLAFLFFKNAVIVQGVAQRAAAGVASSPVAHRVSQLLPQIIQECRDLLRPSGKL